MQHPKIIICGNYGATNLGDEAILDGILELVRRAHPSAQITVLSARPEETKSLHNGNSTQNSTTNLGENEMPLFADKSLHVNTAPCGNDGILKLNGSIEPKNSVKSLHVQTQKTPDSKDVNRSVNSLPSSSHFRSTPHFQTAYLLPAGFRSFFKGLFSGEIWRTLKILRECDLFILGGGGLFTDEKMMAIVIWSFQARFALLFGKPLFCFAQSVGPLKTFFGRAMTRGIFKRARMITVRDSGSAKLLGELEIEKDGPEVHVLADPAFALHVAEPLPEKTENFVVISVRPWKGSTIRDGDWAGKDSGDEIASRNPDLSYKIFAQFIDWLWEKHGLRSVLVPFQTLIDDDSQQLNKIFEQVKNKEAAEIFEFTEQYQKIIELITKARAVVGMRLHSLIFSTLVQKPFLALSYSNKVRQFVEDLGLDDYVIDLEFLMAESNTGQSSAKNVQPDSPQQEQNGAEGNQLFGLSLLKNCFELLLKNYDKVTEQLCEKSLVMRKKAHTHEELLRELIGKISH